MQPQDQVLKKFDTIQIDNTYEEGMLAFEGFLKERMHRSSIDKLKSNSDSYDLLLQSFLSGWRLGTKRVVDALSKQELYIIENNLLPNQDK